MARYQGYAVREIAVRHGNAQRRSNADAGGDAADHFHLDPCRPQHLQFLAAAPEHKRIAALDAGLSAATIMDDLPVGFMNDGHDWRLMETSTDAYSIAKATSALPEDRVWVPKNFDGKYFGPVTLRRGLALSRNIVAVRLIDKIGPARVVEWAQKLGITSPLDPFLSLGLGTSVVSLLELTSAYGAIAAEGIRSEPYAIDKITDFEGRVI